MIKAIIFDCFGVVRIDAFDAAYQSFGGDVTADQKFIKETMYASHAGNIPSSVPVIATHLGIDPEVWQKAVDEGSTLNQEVLDYALELRKTYKTAMLSNLGSGGLQRMFEPGLLGKYFEISVASGDIGFAKPEARAYETVCDLLQVRLDESVFIDDRQEYIDGAIAVGMQAVLFTSANQLKEELKRTLSA